MSEDWIAKAQRGAAERVIEEMGKPFDDDCTDSGKYFDPWELFPGLYGNYSNEFDWCALGVLESLGKYDGSAPSDLASEMFREMLCNLDLCDYGTSPRACFPTSDFEAILPAFIEKWKGYYAVKWGKPFTTPKDGKAGE